MDAFLVARAEAISPLVIEATNSPLVKAGNESTGRVTFKLFPWQSTRPTQRDESYITIRQRPPAGVPEF